MADENRGAIRGFRRSRFVRPRMGVLLRGVAAPMLTYFGLQTATALAACAPAKLLNTIKMIPAKNSALEFVPVTINGIDQRLLLDTGGAGTSLTLKTVTQLQLPTQRNMGARLIDVNGNIVDRLVTIGTFTMGEFRGSRMNFSVMPSPTIEAIGGAGLLAGDLLFEHDLEMDFSQHALRQYSQDHCEGSVGVRQGGKAEIVPMRILAGHIQIKAKLDGVSLDAILDTGASTSVLRQSAAEKAVGPGADWSKDTVGEAVNGDASTVGHYHNFAMLSLGEMAISGPRLLVMPDRMNERSLGTMHTRMPALIVGMDMLKDLHAYLAVDEGKLYVFAPPRVESPLLDRR